MTITDKRKQVLNLLSHTNYTALIEEIYDLLHSFDKIDDVDVDQMPEPLVRKISKAIDDYKTGNYITHEEMKQKLQQWLTK